MGNSGIADGRFGIVIIGRNEGPRLVACLESCRDAASRTVYVDSGSEDRSVENAEEAGVAVVRLDLTKPFTAARARNAGWKDLVGRFPELEYVHFVDGDCFFADEWLGRALGFMDKNPGYAIACGRRREIDPGGSVFNALCDIEWNTPVGDALACGGDALVRVEALAAVDGYPDGFIAGEEPEMCYRLRTKGWKIRRLDADMTWHDAAMSNIGQWWKRVKRSGFAYALGFDAHGGSPEGFNRRPVLQIAAWAIVLPVAAAVATAIVPWGAFLFLLYPLQFLRLAFINPSGKKHGWRWAFFIVLGRFPEALGLLSFYSKKATGRAAELIEYK